jgi:T-complex protein 1 subunit eta
MWFGVNVIGGNVDDMYKLFVWEPEQVRINVLQAATEAACSILSVDQTIRNPKSEQAQAEAAGRLDGSKPPPGLGRGGKGMNMKGLRTMQGKGGK